MYEIKFFEAARPINAGIINVEDWTMEKIKELIKTQRALGRDEIQHPGKDGRIEDADAIFRDGNRIGQHNRLARDLAELLKEDVKS